MNLRHQTETQICQVSHSLAIVSGLSKESLLRPVQLGEPRDEEPADEGPEPLAVTTYHLVQKSFRETLPDLVVGMRPYEADYGNARQQLGKLTRIATAIRDTHPAAEWPALAEMMRRQSMKRLGQRCGELVKFGGEVLLHHRQTDNHHPFELRVVSLEELQETAETNTQFAASLRVLLPYAGRSLRRHIHEILPAPPENYYQL